MEAADLFRALRRIASRNLGLKVVALALAVGAWWFVTGESKVLVSYTVPLEIRNVPKGLTVTNKPERQVEVRLSGPSSLLSGMRPAEISAGVDLSAAKGGRQSFTLDDRAVKVPPGIKVQRIFPSSVEVILDRTERRTVPVAARIGGGAAVRKRVSKEEVVPDRTDGDYSAIARVETREPHAKIVGNPNVRGKIQFRK